MKIRFARKEKKMTEEKQIEEMAKVTSEALMSELGIRLDDKFLLRLAKHF